MEWTARLGNALKSQTLVLFLGPDLPATITGLPSRAELAREMARYYGQDPSLPLAEVAQRLIRGQQRGLVTRFLSDALNPAGKGPRSFHQQIVSFVVANKIETVITTAYDDLLQRAFQQAGQRVYRIVYDADLQLITQRQVTLIKLYGDLASPESLVVTAQDHSYLLQDPGRTALLEEVRRAFMRNTILFVGYNLADPNFQFIFDQVARSQFARVAFAVWPGMAPDERATWDQRGIIILEDDPVAILDALEAPEITPRRADSPEEPSISERRQVDRAKIRSLLANGFSDSELMTMTAEHFPSVYNNFTDSMSKDRKIRLLLDYSYRHEEVDRLLEVIEAANPASYRRYFDS